nr:glycosyltransferase family 2 protein [uncultured Flavobacterium sp.]
MSKLSIITINCNNLEGLKRTVESVVNQTWQEFEYIVIDGGSTDGSAAYIESQSEYIDYWVSESDKGIYNAMNKGILKATGEYLLFLNSGDHFFNDEVLEKNRCYIEKYDLIYFDIQTIGEGISEKSSHPDKLDFHYFYEASISHPGTFIRAKLFSKIGLYDENYKIVSDWKFFITAIFSFHCNYLKINEVLSVFYLDGISSKLSNNTILLSERQQVLDSDFKNLIEDFRELYKLREIVSSLRKSRKIGLLVEFGLVQKF